MWIIFSKDKLPPGDVWLGNSQHVDCGLVQSDENTIVNLSQTEQFQGLSDFRVNTVDTRKKIKRISFLLKFCDNNFLAVVYPLVRTTKARLGWAGT